MNVLQVCAEIFPLLKTGGLADVAGALPAALAAQGASPRVLLPGFASILAGLAGARHVADLAPHAAVPGARLLHGHLPAVGVDAYVIDAPPLYLREGGPYADAHQHPYSDNHLRFARLGWAAAELAAGLDGGWHPHVVHAHDWHAGLAPACLHALGRPAPSLYTVHNLAYQGAFDAHHFGELGLPGAYFQMHGLEAYGQVNFMKAGLYYADQLSTVSPTYAREIQQPEQGMGLHGLLADRAAVLHGILNGVDATVWSPAHDAHLSARYSAADLSGKARNKAALQARMGLALDPGALVFIVISRLTEQKGLGLVLGALPELLARGGQFAMLGEGDPGLQAAFLDMARRHPRQMAVTLGYDEPEAHRLLAAGDVILVPSRFEPCGLTQLYGLAYGTLPLVRRVGGLADTVIDATPEAVASGLATGLVFETFDTPSLQAAMARAFTLAETPDDWRRVQQAGMASRHAWARAARSYLDLYRLMTS